MATETEATFVWRWASQVGPVELRQTRRVVLLWPEDLWRSADLTAAARRVRSERSDAARAQRRKEEAA